MNTTKYFFTECERCHKEKDCERLDNWNYRYAHGDYIYFCPECIEQMQPEPEAED